MAPFLVMTALAASVAPHPLEKPFPPQKWATNDDYPSRALQMRQQGSVRLGLTIDVKGKPIRCVATSNDKLPDLKDLSCALIMKRATYSPALDRNGAPVLGLLSQRINWAMPGGGGTKTDWRVIPDILVAVAKLPGDKKLIEMSLRFDVDAAANVEACAVETTSGLPAFDKAACRAVRPLIEFKPALDANGKPEPSVQVFSVAFGVPNVGK